ncbi:hypothetical protein N8I77_012415 [Diaporthe amygdali]|uniref:Peroxin 20 n=1 Tax=Phomopsis amygdali TaxID=1214568 RepID=A0AAD9S2R8_PHOAM|nr:hypothetical protein N8I77_012415 [Diaporthe amygdali]
MSDNLCGPSAPTKGLVGHLDRDRSLQQDRVAGSPASAAGSFRSTAPETIGTSSADAAFANFTAAPPQPNAAASRQANVAPKVTTPYSPFNMLPGYRHGLGNPWDGAPDKLDLVNHVNPAIPARRGGMDHQRPSAAALKAPDTSWVSEFQQRRQDELGLNDQMEALRLQNSRTAGQSGAYLPPHMMSFNAPGYAPVYGQPGFAAQGGQYYPNGQPMMYGNAAQYGQMMPSHAPGFGQASVAAQGGQYVAAGQPGQQETVTPHGYSAPNGIPFSHYPQNIALAANTEEALGAAFAAYDQEFEGEMDQWVAAHGPEDREDHEAVMTEHAEELDAARKKHDPKVMSQSDPETRYRLKRKEDVDLHIFATKILDTMMQSDNEKFEGSSFTDLMRRIVNREVVVEGEELIDVATGNPTDLTPRDLKPIIPVPDIPPTFIPPSDAELRAKEAELQAKQEAEHKDQPVVVENPGGA